MTHEFKTPISTIAISAEVLKDPEITSTPGRLLNYATIIQNENQRLKQQVDRVLQMAEVDKEDIVLRREKVDLHELIRESVASRKMVMECDIRLDLKAVPSSMLFDRLHITNVIYNLLDNATKYSRVAPQVVITTRILANHNLELCVSDNGIGISLKEQSKIFQKFYRVATGNLHDVRGFGLGLSYVKLMIEKHRGKITVESTPGKGSTFRIVLPLADDYPGIVIPNPAKI